MVNRFFILFLLIIAIAIVLYGCTNLGHGQKPFETIIPDMHPF